MVGHNINQFDLPVIIWRSMKVGAHIPARPVDIRKYGGGDTLDTMWALAHNEKNFTSLKAYADLLGIPRLGATGADVPDMTDDEVWQYVRDDVRVTREVCRKTFGWYF